MERLQLELSRSLLRFGHPAWLAGRTHLGDVHACSSDLVPAYTYLGGHGGGITCEGVGHV